MLTSPARLAANRANATRSTGPRTAEGKAASSTGTRVRVSLSHGAYATDDTLLATRSAPLSTNDAERTHSLHDHESQFAQVDLPVDGDGPALLASFTSHYTPADPAETLLVRRIVAASLRIDLLGQALDALLELGERRALVDHLSERFVINEPKMQVRDAPNYAAMLRRYDGTAEPPPGYDPTLDPDPALCTLAYTLSGPRAAALMRHEATAERRLHAALRELHRLQADRRKQQKERNEPITQSSATARSEANLLPAPVFPDAAPGTPLRPISTDAVPQTHSASSKNEPMPLPPSTPHRPVDAARMEQNEPISAAAARRPTTPGASYTLARPPWDRHLVPSSDTLERLIRDAARRAGHDQYQAGTGRQTTHHHARRVKR